MSGANIDATGSAYDIYPINAVSNYATLIMSDLWFEWEYSKEGEQVIHGSTDDAADYR